jgi:hypothetical protein
MTRLERREFAVQVVSLLGGGLFGGSHCDDDLTVLVKLDAGILAASRLHGAHRAGQVCLSE